MRFEHEAAPIGVDEHMALAAVDLLAGIIAARSTGLRRLHALAVDDSRRGTGLPPNPFTIGHDERVVDLLEQMRGFAAIVLSGDCGPHGNSWVGIRSSWNHVDLDHATYLSKGPFDYFRESAMKLPHRRNFLHLAAGAAGHVADRDSANLHPDRLNGWL